MYVAENRDRPGIYIQPLDGLPALIVTGRHRFRGPAWNPGETLITYTIMDGEDSRLEMLIPSGETPVRKTLVRDQPVNPWPVVWISRDSFLYTAGTLVWERHLDLPWSRVLPITEKQAANRSPGTNLSDFFTPDAETP